MKRFAIFITFLLTSAVTVFSQESVSDTSKQNSYTRAVSQRADKIVATLGLKEPAKATEVRDIITGQYLHLNRIQADRDRVIEQLKLQFANDKDAKTAAIKKAEEAASMRTDSLHTKYLSALSSRLTTEQVAKVKDGMTYNVLPITYQGYQQMIPTLTSEQKKKILEMLTEAREHAMDAESSEKKHAWFGKYKGRINNYLSSAGYDMNKASKEWQARIKAEQAANKN